MYARFGLFIAGEWRASAASTTAPVFSPVTEQSMGECPVASMTANIPIADTQTRSATSADRGRPDMIWPHGLSSSHHNDGAPMPPWCHAKARSTPNAVTDW